MTPFVDDPDFQLHVGDALQVLAGLPAESVHCVVTSPPYWGLRDYSCDGQIGLEPTLDAYVETMVGVFREVRRVMRTDATLWLNLGDAFGAKQMLGMPWRVAFALQADGWYLRSDIIWSKPNPMPESVTDRPTKAHEYLFLLTRSPRYFYDADAIREPHTAGNLQRQLSPNGDRGDSRTFNHAPQRYLHPAGRNKRSVWEIATEPYPDAHFATFPQALVEPCVLAGTSERGCCPVCGAPWERETARERVGVSGDWRGHKDQAGVRHAERRGFKGNAHTDVETTGWRPTCTCGTFTEPEATRRRVDTYTARPGSVSVPCTVLDPFMGSGTTALVARRLGRRTIGIELSAEYATLAATRLQQLSLLAEGAA